MISVVIPAFNEEKMIERTSRIIDDILTEAKINHELIFVNDGSKDGTWREIQLAHEKNPAVKGLSFSRNFGKEAAIMAGLRSAEGDCAVVIDCDLQHPPEKIVDMYRLWENGYEIVEGVKRSRGKEGAAHGFAAKCFYGLISNATGIDMSNASDYKLVDRMAINALINMREKDAFFRALSSWVGFKTTQIYYDVREREEGESKWSTTALVKYALTNITSFTSVPLQIVTILGVFMFGVGAVLAAVALISWLRGDAMEGFTTVIILQCMSSSIIMVGIGIVGYYVSKIYEGIQDRPKYIISATAGKCVIDGESSVINDSTYRKDL